MEDIVRKIQIPLPWDMHHHGREGDLLKLIMGMLANRFQGAVLMPNLSVPIFDADRLKQYQDEVFHAIGRRSARFCPIFTFQVTAFLMPKSVKELQLQGARAGKVYPRNLTTNSEHGVSDYETIYSTLEDMEHLGLIALFHGESPNPHVDVEDRELKFLDILNEIVNRFPRLKIVFEHITTAAAVEWVAKAPDNVAATITPHHLQLTSTDVRGGKFKPHLFCKPEAKRFADRMALRLAAISGNPKFFAGTDSAPHPRHMKECRECCAGIFCGPVAIETYAEEFANLEEENKLAGFLSINGPRFYGLEPSAEWITLVEDPPEKRRKIGIIPFGDDVLVPYREGQELVWRIE